MKRTAGPDADRYRVRDNSWWIVRGRRSHLFWCGSPLDVEPIPATPPDLVYVDPPWGDDAPSSLFAEKRDSYWLDVYRHTAALAAGGPCFCESSRLTADQIAEVLTGDTHARWDLTHPRYRSVLHYAGPPIPKWFDPTDRDADESVIDMLLMGFPGETVIDPYAGYGATAQAAERHGWASINIEPNPRRVSTALARLCRVTKTEPRELD